MPYAIRRPGTDQFLCGSNTTLPQWGDLSRFSNLVVFPTEEVADTFMENCQSIEFYDDDEIVHFTLGQKED